MTATTASSSPPWTGSTSSTGPPPRWSSPSTPAASTAPNPPARPGRLVIAGPEFTVTRDTVLDLLELRLVYTADVVRINRGPGSSRPGAQTGEETSAYVLTATHHGRDVLDVAHRIGRLPR